MGNREVGCLRKGWLVGTPVVLLGHPRVTMFLESVAFIKGSASMGALRGMSGGVCIFSLGGKNRRGGDLSCSGFGLGKQGGDLLYGAEDLSYLHGCAFRAGIQVQHSPSSAPWYTSLQALHICIRPVLLLLSQCHLGWAGGSGSWCPEDEVSWQDQDRGWSRPPAPPSAHVRLPVPRR